MQAADGLRRNDDARQSVREGVVLSLQCIGKASYVKQSVKRIFYIQLNKLFLVSLIRRSSLVEKKIYLSCPSCKKGHVRQRGCLHL